jgi:hypothetical protein
MTAQGNRDVLRYVAGIRNRCKPVLIVIDTMARSLGKLNESESATASMYLEMTQVLRDAFPGCATLTLAHAGKDDGRGLRGSSAFTAGFDAVWKLERNKSTGITKLEATHLKDADDLGPYGFRLHEVHVEGGKSAVIEWHDVSDSWTRRQPAGSGESDAEIEITLRVRNAVDWIRGLTDMQLAEIIVGECTSHDPTEIAEYKNKVKACYKRLHSPHLWDQKVERWGPRDGKLGSCSAFQSDAKSEWRWHLCENQEKK